MNLILLISSILILLVVTFWKRNDFSSPSIFFIAPLTIAIITCFIYQDSWGFDCSISTCLLLTIGFIAFFAGDEISRLFTTPLEKANDVAYRRIDIGFIKYIAICSYVGICTVFVYREVSSAVMTLSGAYTMFSTSTKGLDGYTGNILIANLFTSCSVIAYLLLAAMISNATFRVFKKKDLLSIIPMVGYLTQVLLQGQRGDLINFVISAIFFTLIFRYKREGGGPRKSLRFLIGQLKYVIIAIVAFYLLRIVIAKPGQTSLSFGNVISGYFGASIDLLNRLVEARNIHYLYWGYETFHDLYSFLEKIGVFHDLPTVRFPFRNYNGLGCNVYTFFKRPFVDFGIGGALIAALLCGSVFGYFYYKNVHVRNATGKYLFHAVLFGYFANKIALSFFDDYMTILLSMNTLIKIVFMIIFYNILYKKIYINIRK